MSNAQSEIRSAIVQAYEALALPLETAYSNAPFTEPDSSTPFIRLYVLSAESFPATLGQSGEDRHSGILQLDLMYPANEGEQAALAMADSILTAFRAGTSSTYNGQAVYFLGGSRSSGQIDSGRWRITLSIRWYALAPRI